MSTNPNSHSRGGTFSRFLYFNSVLYFYILKGVTQGRANALVYIFKIDVYFEVFYINADS
jgi:hypothetical protein